MERRSHAAIGLLERITGKAKRIRRCPIPDFGNPFSGLAKDRKLTHEELVRAMIENKIAYDTLDNRQKHPFKVRERPFRKQAEITVGSGLAKRSGV